MAQNEGWTTERQIDRPVIKRSQMDYNKEYLVRLLVLRCHTVKTLMASV
jgi:hypothetical protein